jgi:photosystem II stability/assembly factor-like uncharacterized protein
VIAAGCDGGTRGQYADCRLRLHPDGTLFCVITGKKSEDGILMADGVGLYRSADQGGHWEKLTGGLDLRWLLDCETDPRDSRILYLAACDSLRRSGESGLYKTRDGGRSWKRMACKSSTHFGVTRHPGNPDWVYMTLTYNDGRISPLWLSRDAGTTWTAFDDFPFCSAQRVTFDPDGEKLLYVTTFGANVWKGPIEP